MEAVIFWAALIIVTLVYMTGWFGIAQLTKRYDVVDSAWGLGFVMVAWVSLAIRMHFGLAQVVSAILVSLWGLRLFAHIANRNWRKSEDDTRYQVLRKKWGSAEKQKAYTNVFLLQGGLLLLISTTMVAITFADRSANVFSWVGWLVWLVGIAFEAVSDWQLGRFIRSRPKGSHQIMDRGLWQYSRHPNYFGEVTAWWGAAIVALSLSEWWGVLGAIIITILITKVSGIPILEKHYDGNRDYEVYRKRTSVFVPLPRKS